MYYSRDKGSYFTSPEILPAIPTLSEFFFWANSYFEVLGEKPPTKKLTEVN